MSYFENVTKLEKEFVNFFNRKNGISNVTLAFNEFNGDTYNKNDFNNKTFENKKIVRIDSIPLNWNLTIFNSYITRAKNLIKNNSNKIFIDNFLNLVILKDISENEKKFVLFNSNEKIIYVFYINENNIMNYYAIDSFVVSYLINNIKNNDEEIDNDEEINGVIYDDTKKYDLDEFKEIIKEIYEKMNLNKEIKKESKPSSKEKDTDVEYLREKDPDVEYLSKFINFSKINKYLNEREDNISKVDKKNIITVLKSFFNCTDVVSKYGYLFADNHADKWEFIPNFKDAKDNLFSFRLRRKINGNEVKYRNIFFENIGAKDSSKIIFSYDPDLYEDANGEMKYFSNKKKVS